LFFLKKPPGQYPPELRNGPLSQKWHHRRSANPSSRILSKAERATSFPQHAEPPSAPACPHRDRRYAPRNPQELRPDPPPKKKQTKQISKPAVVHDCASTAWGHPPPSKWSRTATRLLHTIFVSVCRLGCGFMFATPPNSNSLCTILRQGLGGGGTGLGHRHLFQTSPNKQIVFRAMALFKTLFGFRPARPSQTRSRMGDGPHLHFCKRHLTAMTGTTGAPRHPTPEGRCARPPHWLPQGY